MRWYMSSACQSFVCVALRRDTAARLKCSRQEKTGPQNLKRSSTKGSSSIPPEPTIPGFQISRTSTKPNRRLINITNMYQQRSVAVQQQLLKALLPKRNKAVSSQNRPHLPRDSARTPSATMLSGQGNDCSVRIFQIYTFPSMAVSIMADTSELRIRSEKRSPRTQTHLEFLLPRFRIASSSSGLICEGSTMVFLEVKPGQASGMPPAVLAQRAQAVFPQSRSSDSSRALKQPRQGSPQSRKTRRNAKTGSRAARRNAASARFLPRPRPSSSHSVRASQSSGSRFGGPIPARWKSVSGIVRVATTPAR
mmetsp:Transcript_47956/g.136973  ORF Transcript_47956/g.136973 Transcript_47956/m.136973 type:complete len:308 (-) Transcript_47956:125-1048(-)